MCAKKSYALLCPIARALDFLGDRWALLILRELHAGPGRFSDLRAALPGLAANLLTTRLTELADAGLLARDGERRGARYLLTDLGRATRPVLFELARFGAQLPLPERITEPGNRRHLAVTLAAASERAAARDLSLRAEIVIDGQAFSFVVARGTVSMEAGAMLAPPLRYATRYETLGPVVAGALPFSAHLAQHARIECFDGTDPAPFLRLMADALDIIGGRRA